jgi:nicotinamide-nucleotide amidase
MRALFPQVEALVAEAFGARLTPALARSIHTTGVPESLLAPRIEAALGSDRDGVDVAYLPDLSGVELRLTARRREGESEADVSRRISAIEDRMGEVLDGIRYDAPSGDVVEALLGALIERRWRVAVAESCTGGLLGQRLTARPGASLVFEGGVIAYADAVKEALLGVPGATLEAEGAVSEAVARAMAAGVARSLGTECGVGITGVAGPGGGSAEKPVGTVWIGWCVRDEFGETVDAEHFRFGDDREAVRARAAQAAVWGLLRRVLAAGPAE